jgi:hypothetical protein
MACLDPETADCAADMARADDADFHLGVRGRLSQRDRRGQHRRQDEGAGTREYRAAAAINTDWLEHPHTRFRATCSLILPSPSIRVLYGGKWAIRISCQMPAGNALHVPSVLSAECGAVRLEDGSCFGSFKQGSETSGRHWRGPASQ